jgi:hypothetical protein
MIGTADPDTKATADGLAVREARARCERAREVLAELVRAREACEAQLSRESREDAYRVVTGRSALDEAIASTRRMVSVLERSVSRAGA